eukprot:655262-Hanusia_phi.AAC.1
MALRLVSRRNTHDDPIGSCPDQTSLETWIRGQSRVRGLLTGSCGQGARDARKVSSGTMMIAAS